MPVPGPGEARVPCPYCTRETVVSREDRLCGRCGREIPEASIERAESREGRR